MSELEQNPQSNIGAVMRCGLSESEYKEREMLIEFQKNSRRWFSQEEFDR